MDTVIPFLVFVVGLVLIIKSGDSFVDSACWAADVTGIPKFIVAATIVSFATTLPELLVSCYATMQGSPDMAIGNAIGSVACNTGLILGVSLLVMPGGVDRKSFLGKSLIMVAACAMLGLFAGDARLSLLEAIFFFVLLAIFLYSNISGGKKETDGRTKASRRERDELKKQAPKRILFFVLSTVGLVIGARLLVDNGTLIAKIFGVPDAIVAVTLVALGTSLPELVTTISALVKKEYALSVGNVVGANTLNMVLIMPACTLITNGSLPISIPEVYVDVIAALVFFAIFIIPAMIRGKFMRAQGLLLLLAYASYLFVRIRYFGA